MIPGHAGDGDEQRESDPHGPDCLAAEGAIDKRIHISKFFYAALGTKLTASYSIVPVVSGKAKIALLTIHFIFGIGLEL